MNDNYISVCFTKGTMNEANITYYLERELKKLHDEIQSKHHSIHIFRGEIVNAQERIDILKVHYTSLLNTALAYEDFDKEDFESGL